MTVNSAGCRVHHEQGFVLVGVMAALIIITSLTMTSMEHQAIEIDNQQVMRAALDGHQLIQGVLNAYAENGPDLADRWPVDPPGSDTRIDQLITDGFLIAGIQPSIFGTNWQLTVAANTLTATVTLVAPDTTTARFLCGQLPQCIPPVTGTTVSSTLNRPGDEAVHNLLYARDGSRTLTGTLDADGQEINDQGGATYEP